MRYRYSTRVEVKDGLYQVSTRYFLGGDMPYEDFAFEFTGHYSIDDIDTVPFEIYVKAGTPAA